MAEPVHAVDPSREPDRVREAVWAALGRAELPASFLYESPGQAARWLAYHHAWSPSRRDGEVRALYAHAFRFAAARLAGRGACCLAGLGCGGGQKDADAAQALREARPGALHYVAVDSSAPLVAEASRVVRERVPDVHVHPLEADLSAEPRLRAWTDARSGAAATLFTCFGMLPNLDAPRFAAYVAGLMRPGDALLISANLSPNGYGTDRERILAQYDNAEARAWYAGALAELGVDGGGAALSVTAERMAADGSRWRVVVIATARRHLALQAFGRTFPIRAGQRLRVFYSNRFTEGAARALLERAGLRVRATWWDRGGEEGIFCCEPER